MKRGDLVILTNSNTKFEGSYGISFDYDLEHPERVWVPKDNVWVPNGTVGMYWMNPVERGGKFGVLVEGRLLWFDQLDSRTIDETR